MTTSLWDQSYLAYDLHQSSWNTLQRHQIGCAGKCLSLLQVLLVFWPLHHIVKEHSPHTLRPLPVVHRSRTVRWAAGGRWCSHPGTLRGPQPWWPSPSGPSSAPPGPHSHRAALRSPQCEPSWGSQHRFLGCNELSPEVERRWRRGFSIFTLDIKLHYA